MPSVFCSRRGDVFFFFFSQAPEEEHEEEQEEDNAMPLALSETKHTSRNTPRVRPLTEEELEDNQWMAQAPTGRKVLHGYTPVAKLRAALEQDGLEFYTWPTTGRSEVSLVHLQHQVKAASRQNVAADNAASSSNALARVVLGQLPNRDRGGRCTSPPSTLQWRRMRMPSTLP